MKNQQISDQLICFQSYQKYWKKSSQLNYRSINLENNNLLNEIQYECRNNSSTENVLANVTQQIYKSTDKGKISLLVLLGPSKVFDSVNHDLLLNKLVQLNIDSTWLARYLHDRTHSVKK